MLDKLLKFLIGGRSKRVRMTLLYIIIYVTITMLDKMDSVAFSTLSAAFATWIVGDTIKKGKDSE